MYKLTNLYRIRRTSKKMSDPIEARKTENNEIEERLAQLKSKRIKPISETEGTLEGGREGGSH